MTYRINQIGVKQLQDIAHYLEALNSMDISLEDHPDNYGVPNMGWGDGFRTVLDIKAIPVKSDADEIVGSLVRDDYAWYFKPNDAEEAK